MTSSVQERLGIVRIIPSLIQREQVWFAQNNHLIQKEARNPFSWWSNNYKEIDKDERIAMSVLLRTLSDWGYQKVSTLQGPGEYATRGGILDVFPINHKTGFRLEFQGNTVNSIEALPQITLSDTDKTIQEAIVRHPLHNPSLQQKEAEEHRAVMDSLKKDSFVVHINHGIGILRDVITADNISYFLIEYASNDTLRVPTTAVGRVMPYVGFANPTLTRLGGNSWDKIKAKAKEDIQKVARELLHIYAQRELATKDPYALEHHRLLEDIEDSFPFVETTDQQKALKDVYKDLLSNKPMDRVIVADVGFGKTEIALRASALAVEAGKQVALIAPTTILAHQHYKTFQERFQSAGSAVEIAKLTRIETKAHQKQTLSDLRSGQVNIVIGTHRLLQKDIGFQNLGLVIIDEEQRFGVKQKETLKAYRANIDILSLSATPIPRTLSSTLAQIRDMSIIHTPPQGRKPIRSHVQPFQNTLIRKALEQELSRGGQVYYLHNRILSLYRTVQNVQKLAPQARVVSLHAQLPEQKIIEIIDAFTEKKIDILISTTIMENGLDIINANTLIVEDATMLGLAQLHQIRGRIGRSHKQAYAHFFYPNRKKLPRKTRERLDALIEFQDLGVGYEIALRDLEIRGAGSLLGKAQSGHIGRIGFNLYCQLLNETIEQIKTQDTPSQPLRVL